MLMHPNKIIEKFGFQNELYLDMNRVNRLQGMSDACDH